MRELGQLQKHLADFEALDVDILGVTMDKAAAIGPNRKKFALDGIDILADTNGDLMDALGLRHQGAGPGGTDVARSASLLFDSEGRLLWMEVTENYRVRPQPEHVLAEVRRALPTGEAGPEGDPDP